MNHFSLEPLAMLVSYYTGAKLVFMPAFDLQRYLALVQKYKVTRSFVVPPIITALLKHPIVDNYDLSSLKVLPYTCMYVCMYVCTYVCMYVYMYVLIYHLCGRSYSPELLLSEVTCK
jgi:hypothetical protein